MSNVGEQTVLRELPAHVRPENVVTLPLFSRQTFYENPHETLIPQMHATLPRISYATNVFPGNQPGWMLKHMADIQAVLRDPDNYTKNGVGRLVQSIGEDWLIIPTEVDPPAHAGYRATMNIHFSPKKIAEMREQIQGRARALIAKFKDRGECDFINEFSQQYPINIVLDLLGLPQNRLPEFLRWEKDMLHSNDLQARSAAVRSVKNYLCEEIKSRSVRPRDDYMTLMLGFESHGRKWTSEEVLGHCFNLYLGGLDTVTSLLGNIFNYLAHHPEQQARLRSDPTMINPAVEELLRAFGPVTVFRVAATEHELHGQKIMPGDYVTVSTSMAGRDPAAYDQPQDVRFDRRANHISLGGGIHMCLGMHLARLELRTALEEFLSAIPEFRIKDGFRVPYFYGNILQIPDLKLQW